MAKEPTLSAGQVRDLKTLIKNDFETARKELQRQYNEMNAEISKEREKHDAEQRKLVDKRVKKLNGIIQRFNNAVAAEVQAMQEDGFQTGSVLSMLTVGRDAGSYISAPTDEVFWEQAEDARSAVNQQFNDAHRTLDSEQNRLFREVVLTQLTSAAAVDFVNQIPTAAELMPPPASYQALTG